MIVQKAMLSNIQLEGPVPRRHRKFGRLKNYLVLNFKILRDLDFGPLSLTTLKYFCINHGWVKQKNWVILHEISVPRNQKVKILN